MKKILIKSFNPSFNRIDFVKYISNHTSFGLIESKFLLDKVIDGEEVFIEIECHIIDNFIKDLEKIGVYCKLHNMDLT